MNFPKHLFSLDISRGLAATAVVFYHWQHFFLEQGKNFNRSQQPLYSLLRPLYDHGNHAVPFFFQLSGFVFFWLYRDEVASGNCSAYRFGVLRFARLYPLHVATLLIVLVLQAIHARVIGGYFMYSYNDFYHFVLHLFFISNWGFEHGASFNGPIWSVSIEIGLYCIFFLFCSARALKSMKFAVLLICPAAMIKLGWGSQWAPAVLAFFIGGLTFELVSIYLVYRTRLLDSLFIISAIIAWVGILTSNRIEYLLLLGHHDLFFLYPLTICCLVVAETRFPDFPKGLGWIGNLTYSSYLLHFPLQLVFVLCTFGLGYDKTVFEQTSTLIAFLLLLCVFSLIAFHGLERPMQSIIRNALLSKKGVTVHGSVKERFLS